MADKKKRPADIFGGKGSLAGGLRARRAAIEEGDITEPDESPSEAFKQGTVSEEARAQAVEALKTERDKEEERTRKERRKKEYGE